MPFLRNGMLDAHIDPKHWCCFLFFLIFVSFVMAGIDTGLLRAACGLLVSGIIILSRKQKCERMFRGSLLELSP